MEIVYYSVHQRYACFAEIVSISTLNFEEVFFTNLVNMIFSGPTRSIIFFEKFLDFNAIRITSQTS